MTSSRRVALVYALAAGYYATRALNELRREPSRVDVAERLGPWPPPAPPPPAPRDETPSTSSDETRPSRGLGVDGG